MSEANAFHMVRRRARETWIEARIGCHTFRATGNTVCLENCVRHDKVRRRAAHESARAVKFYDRTADRLIEDEVDRLAL